MIDVTITATMRSYIFRQTVSSFKKYLFKDDLFKGKPPSVIINIDPVGPDPDVRFVLSVVRQYLSRIVFIRVPGEPSFPKAFKWVWSQTEADFVFHLEDDWELLRPIDLGRMIEVMKSKPDLAALRLPWKATQADSMKNWRYFFPWNGEFFECPTELKRAVGFCGHPSLIRGEFVRNTVKLLDPTRNPEKQFHHGDPALLEEVDKWRYGVFARPNEPSAIRDIGRKWMVANGWRKAGSKAFFTTWEKIDA